MNEIDKIVSTEKIGKRKIKRAKVIADVVDGKLTLADIGRKHYPTAEYPSQTVSSAISRETYQKDIAEIIGDSEISPEFLRRELKSSILGTKPKDTVRGKYLELGMRANAMLTDKNLNENRNQDVLPALDQVPLDRLSDELVKRLKVDSQGLTPISVERASNANVEANKGIVDEQPKLPIMQQPEA